MSSVADLVIHASHFLETTSDKFPALRGNAAAGLKAFLEARSTVV